MALYYNYTLGNAIAFNLTAFASISFIVFVSSTQPFYLSEVLGYSHKDNIGYLVGLLGFADEVTAIVCAPLVGALSDKISVRYACGPRAIIMGGFVLIAFSLFAYGTLVSSFFPGLLFYRCVLAVGFTACMSMVTVMFTEISNSDFDLSQSLRTLAEKFFWRSSRSEYLPLAIESIGEPDIGEPAGVEPEVDIEHDAGSGSTERKPVGKYAAMIGISSGLGAIFAVSSYLTLPSRLLLIYEHYTMAECIQLAYKLVGGIALVVGVALFFFLYSNEVPSLPSSRTGTNYFQLLRHGLEISRHDTRVQLSYVGSLVARLSAVNTAIFIPLLVFNFYSKSGLCNAPGQADKETCRDGYVFAAILTGVAQTVALLFSGVWGFLIDHRAFGKYKCLMMSSLAGILGTMGICVHAGLTGGSGIYDPRNVFAFVLVSFIGISQIGAIMSSMSLLSSVVEDTKDLVSIGSISGVYSLFGGIGILLLSTIGGGLSDKWIMSSFFLLGVFNMVLFGWSAKFWSV